MIGGNLNYFTNFALYHNHIFPNCQTYSAKHQYLHHQSNPTRNHLADFYCAIADGIRLSPECPVSTGKVRPGCNGE